MTMACSMAAGSRSWGWTQSLAMIGAARISAAANTAANAHDKSSSERTRLRMAPASAWSVLRRASSRLSVVPSPRSKSENVVCKTKKIGRASCRERV